MLYCDVRVPLLLANCFPIVTLLAGMIWKILKDTWTTRLPKKSNLYMFPHEHEDINKQHLL